MTQSTSQYGYASEALTSMKSIISQYALQSGPNLAERVQLLTEIRKTQMEPTIYTHLIQLGVNNQCQQCSNFNTATNRCISAISAISTSIISKTIVPIETTVSTVISKPILPTKIDTVCPYLTKKAEPEVVLNG